MGLLFHTMATPELEPVDAIRMASRLGFDGIELICQAGYRCGISPSATTSEARAIKRISADSGISVEVLSSYEKRFAVVDSLEREEALDVLRRELDLVGEIGFRNPAPGRDRCATLAMERSPGPARAIGRDHRRRCGRPWNHRSD